MLDANIKVIFFDAGHTLLYPHPSVGAIYGKTARAHGATVTNDAMERAFHAAWDACHAEAVAAHLRMDDEDWWRRAVFKTLDFAGAKMNDRDAYFRELYELFASPEVWRLFPETTDVLRELTRRGHQLGLISNWDSRLRPLLGALGIASYFQSMTISSEVDAEKPDAAIFNHALDKHSVEAATALHVGDSLIHDVQGATRVGIKTVLLSRRGVKNYDGAVIRSLRELL